MAMLVTSHKDVPMLVCNCCGNMVSYNIGLPTEHMGEEIPDLDGTMCPNCGIGMLQEESVPFEEYVDDE